MRIGVLTLNLNYNYGGILQAYALCQVLKGMGHSTLLIQRKKNYSVVQWLRKIIGMFLNKDTMLLSSLLCGDIATFVEKHIPERTRPLSRKELFTICEKEQLDAIIVGSDQIWRNWDKRIVKSSFLDFCYDKHNLIRIAYAASFGNANWQYNSEDTLFIKKHLSKFRALSVREVSGISLCNQYLHLDVKLVLDPTLLLEPVRYESILGNKTNSCSVDSIAVYVLDDAKWKEEIVSNISSILNLNEQRLTPPQKERLLNVFFSYSKCKWSAVEHWLSCIKDSHFVVTDSYHGTIFSILFRKPFVVLENEQRGASRIESILELLNLEDRLLKNGNTLLNTVNKPIDWSNVEKNLKEWRIKSISFLENSLN